MGLGGDLLTSLCVFWRTIVTVVTPLVFLPMIFVYPIPQVQCGYVILVMAVFWITECVPLGLTAFLPIIIFPMMGVLSVSEVTRNYMTNTHLMIFGSVMIAIAVERSGLHKRAALKTMMLFGASPRRLLFGVMFSTWFLSMWLNNIGTTAMIIPVVDSIIKELRVIANCQRKRHLSRVSQMSQSSRRMSTAPEDQDRPRKKRHLSKLSHCSESAVDEASLDLIGNQQECVHIDLGADDEPVHVNGVMNAMDMEMVMEPEKPLDFFYDEHEAEDLEEMEPDVFVKEPPKNIDKEQRDQLTEAISKMLMIAICYSGNIGGTSSVIGTTPNILAHDIWHEEYAHHKLESPVTFVTWMPMAMPGATMMLILTWIWLQIFFLRKSCFVSMSKEDEVATKRILRQQYEEMGEVKYSEKSCLAFFIVLFLLWFFRDPGFIEGYNSLFKNRYITDSIPSILISFLLFVFPSERPRLPFLRKEGEPIESVCGLLEWKHTMSKLPWTAFFMIGGAFAMAQASKISGLSQWVGDQLDVLEDLPTTLIVLIVCIIVSIITQIAFNLATISLVFPILMSLSEKIGEHPLHFTIPATMVCSSAFMLPASTAPNAMVYEASNLKVIDMIGCGFVINVMFVLVTWLGTETWVAALFDFSTLPWGGATVLNATVAPLLENVTMT